MVLDGIKLTKEENCMYIPTDLRHVLCHFLDLEFPNIKYKFVPFNDIMNNTKRFTDTYDEYHLIHPINKDVDYEQYRLYYESHKNSRNNQIARQYNCHFHQKLYMIAFVDRGYPRCQGNVFYEPFISHIDEDWLLERLCTFWKKDISPDTYEYLMGYYTEWEIVQRNHRTYDKYSTFGPMFQEELLNNNK